MVELTSDDLNYFSAFERITAVMPVDFLVSELGIYYLVPMNELGKAIGKNGSNMEKLRAAMKRKVVVVGDSNDPEEFVRNFFNNVEIVTVEVREAMGDKAVFLTIAEKDRGIAIGKSGERIKALKELLKKKFNATINMRTQRSVI